MSAAQGENGSLLDQKIKALSFTDKEKDKKKYNVLLILDPDREEIRFEPKAWQDGDEKRYCYLGNNARASKQFYAVRDVKSFLNYWTGKGGGVLQALLDFLDEGELKEQLLLCGQKSCFQKQDFPLVILQAGTLVLLLKIRNYLTLQMMERQLALKSC